MGMCFAPGCNHKHPMSCKMFTVPKDPKEFMIWEKLLACRTDKKLTNTAVVCSCHFQDGKKENSPTIFGHNKEKRFAFTSPEKRTRKKKVTESKNVAVFDQPEACSSKSVELVSEENIAESNVELLYLKIKDLEAQLEIEKSRNQFRYQSIKNNDNLIRLYTGLPDNNTFQALLTYLSAFQFCYYLKWKVIIFTHEDQLFITLMKLRLNFPHLDLATRFGCFSATVTNVYLTWVYLMHNVLFKAFLSKIPSRLKTKTCLPSSFSAFTNCRITLDCTEVRISRTSDMKTQKDTYSNYKHTNTYKALLGLAPNGVIVFVSDLYPGSISDKQIFQCSKLSEQLTEGDMILVDKGFLIRDLVPRGVTVNMPPFLMSPQFSRDEAITTLNIARCRIHVERANARIKAFRILHLIPKSLKQHASIVFQVCSSLVNLQNPLIREIEPYLDVE